MFTNSERAAIFWSNESERAAIFFGFMNLLAKDVLEHRKRYVIG